MPCCIPERAALSHVPKPILCYVTDRQSLPRQPGATPEQALEAAAARAAQAGADWIEVREKDLATRALLELARRILPRVAPARVVVNDRLDVAWAAGAAGVHLGGNSLPVAAVARWLRERGEPDFLLGKSCHSAEEAQAAERDGADYVFFGPIFATPSKLAYGPPQGLVRLEEVCRRVRVPVIAIGGIAGENARSCIEAGAAGIAAIRWFQEAGDLGARVAALRASLGGVRVRERDAPR